MISVWAISVAQIKAMNFSAFLYTTLLRKITIMDSSFKNFLSAVAEFCKKENDLSQGLSMTEAKLILQDMPTDDLTTALDYFKGGSLFFDGFQEEVASLATRLISAELKSRK